MLEYGQTCKGKYLSRSSKLHHISGESNFMWWFKKKTKLLYSRFLVKFKCQRHKCPVICIDTFPFLNWINHSLERCIILNYIYWSSHSVSLKSIIFRSPIYSRICNKIQCLKYLKLPPDRDYTSNIGDFYAIFIIQEPSEINTSLL